MAKKTEAEGAAAEAAAALTSEIPVQVSDGAPADKTRALGSESTVFSPFRWRLDGQDAGR